MRSVSAALLAAFTAGFFTSLVAQAPPPIWAGVYTAAQAERGRSVVDDHCSECHHEDLSGGEGPALVGSAFMVKWEMQSVERLFHKIRDTMPEVGSTDVTDAAEARHGGVYPSTERISCRRDRADRYEGRARRNPNDSQRRAGPATLGRAGAGCRLSAEKRATEWILDREHRPAGDDTGSAVAGRQTGVVCGTAGHAARSS